MLWRILFALFGRSYLVAPFSWANSANLTEQNRLQAANELLPEVSLRYKIFNALLNQAFVQSQDELKITQAIIKQTAAMIRTAAQAI